MKAMMIGATNIAAGYYDICAAGGMESMSNVPFLVPECRKGIVYGHGKLLDSILFDGLICPISGVEVGI